MRVRVIIDKLSICSALKNHENQTKREKHENVQKGENHENQTKLIYIDMINSSYCVAHDSRFMHL